MRPLRLRFFLTFLAGIIAATLAASLSGSVASFAATPYEDLSFEGRRGGGALDPRDWLAATSAGEGASR